MKIGDVKDPNAQMIRQYQNVDTRTQAADRQPGTAPITEEKVDLSNEAKDIQKIKNIVTDLPDVREDKVGELKNQIEKGTYQVNSEKIAEKMVGESLIDVFA